MASPEPALLAPYHYRLCRPDQEEPRQPQPRQNIKPTDYFQFIVSVVTRHVSPESDPIMALSTLIHSPCLLRRIRCKRFFQEGQDYLLSNITYPYIPYERLEQITQRVTYEVQQMFELDEETLACPHPDPGLGTKPSDSLTGVTFPLLLEILVDLPVPVPEPEDGEHAAIEESMQKVRMIPASKEAIDSLKKIKLADTKEQCNICMQEFGDGLEDVSAMPCSHVFHHQCLVRWLQTSHMCPLCRYPMPTSNN